MTTAITIDDREAKYLADLLNSISAEYLADGRISKHNAVMAANYARKLSRVITIKHYKNNDNK